MKHLIVILFVLLIGAPTMALAAQFSYQDLLIPDNDGMSATSQQPNNELAFDPAVEPISVYDPGSEEVSAVPPEIPEPTSLILLGMGLTALGLRKFRK